MIWQKNLTSILSVVALYSYFLTYDSFQNPTLQYVRTFLFLGLIAFDLVKKLYQKTANHISEYVVSGSAFCAFLLFNARNYLDVPAKAGVSTQASHLPKIRDFLLVLIVLFSIVSLVYQILLLLSQESEIAQTGIGKEKRTLLQNTLYSFLYISPILIGVNYLAVQRNYNFDISAIGKYSFSEVSRSIIKQVDKEVRIYAFYPRPLEASGKEESWALSAIRPDIEIYLQKLVALNPKFKLEFINADVETDKLADFPGISNGTIVIRAIKENRIGDSPFRDEKIIVVNKKDLEDIERKLVQAVNAVTLPEKKVYFTTTNGERFGSNYLGNPTEQTTKLINVLNFFNY
ncbi:MAG: Gldg family protein, partial [Leptospiraceae bacterium]|nr:Gldg family protein [Leptospiraceae bacterium]